MPSHRLLVATTSAAAVTLAIAMLLTVYSFGLYIYRNRGLFSSRAN